MLKKLIISIFTLSLYFVIKLQAEEKANSFTPADISLIRNFEQQDSNLNRSAVLRCIPASDEDMYVRVYRNSGAHEENKLNAQDPEKRYLDVGEGEIIDVRSPEYLQRHGVGSSESSLTCYVQNQHEEVGVRLYKNNKIVEDKMLTNPGVGPGISHIDLNPGDLLLVHSILYKLGKRALRSKCTLDSDFSCSGPSVPSSSENTMDVSEIPEIEA